MNCCKILFSTVNSAARIPLQSKVIEIFYINYNFIIVVECETLILLQHNIESITLVGDEKQLPATVFSNLCKQIGYSNSLFERLKEGGYPSHFLSTQYRMRPEISLFSNRSFYSNLLKNGENVLLQNYTKPWNNNEIFQPLSFFSVPSVESIKKKSYLNENEGLFVVGLIKEVLKLEKNEITVGIIAGYQSQIDCICIKLAKLQEKNSPKSEEEEFEDDDKQTSSFQILNLTIDVRTIDGFQGQERDIIMFSMTRSNAEGKIGFLNCPRRLNVALTRAKKALWLIGNEETFKMDPLWETLITHCEEHFVSVLDDPLLMSFLGRRSKLGENDDDDLEQVNSYVDFEKVDHGGSIFFIGIPFYATIYDLRNFFASILHSPPFLNIGDSIYNFDVSFTGKAKTSAILTLPLNSLATKFLSEFENRGIMFMDRHLQFKLNTSLNELRHSRLMLKIRRTPYLETEELQLEEEDKRRAGKNISLTCLQFCREKADMNFSAEYESNSPVSLIFKPAPKRVEILTPEMNVVVERNNIERIDFDPDNFAVMLYLIVPATFEYDSNRFLVEEEDIDDTVLKKRRFYLNEQHAISAPYCCERIYLRFPTFSNLENFMNNATKFISPSESILIVTKDNLYSPENLKAVKKLCVQLPIYVAFQVEKLLRNKILDPVELLSLGDEIKKLKSNKNATELLMKFYQVISTSSYDGDLLECFKDVIRNTDPTLNEVHNENEFKCNVRNIPQCQLTYLFMLGYLLDGPFFNQSNRVIRKYYQYQDHFLKVTFTNEHQSSLKFDMFSDRLDFLQKRIGTLLNEGISLCSRHYEFLGYSSSGLREHSVYFVTSFKDDFGNKVNGSTILHNLGDFSKERFYPARFASRLAQAFSSTFHTLTLAKTQLEQIKDVFIKSPYQGCDQLFTDGVGVISKSLAKAVWDATPKGKKGVGKSCPSVFQFRKKLRWRPSMKKFDSPDTDFEGNTVRKDYLQIVKAFYKAGKCYLNRPLVKILEDLGVPADVFLELQREAVAEVVKANNSLECSRLLFEAHNIGTSFRLSNIFFGLMNLGLELDDFENWSKNFLKFSVDASIQYVLREVKNRARDGEIYAAVTDEATGTVTYLKGPVAVSRSPSLHPGDIQMGIRIILSRLFQFLVLAVGEIDEAHCTPEAKRGYTGLVNCVVFSVDTSKAKRSLPSMLSGGDLDGDEYFLICEPRLFPKKTVAAADYPAAEKFKLESTVIRDGEIQTITRTVQMLDISEFFVNYVASDLLGLISSQHLLMADRADKGVFDPIVSVICGTPVDAKLFRRLAITLKKPEFLSQETHTKEEINRYFIKSEKVLGKLWRAISAQKWSATLVDKNEKKSAVELSSENSADLIMSKLITKYNLNVKLSKKSLVNYAEKLLKSFSFELYNIAKANALTSDETLNEVECFAGCILSLTNSKPRRRKLEESLREQTEELFIRVRDDIMCNGKENMAKEEIVERALAIFYYCIRKNDFGAKCCAYVGLEILFELYS
ncbi:hypothetical protein HK099_004012 [Clydaea vesicula]|uniref:RNA-dependent RNA polymerase n=1 Tax=Clydaea vesicula TaxID=447962 RepID=A0AAD5U456_9FUNG|nr:hypothetical protein HK099_004012 [Clydaea vesicula]